MRRHRTLLEGWGHVNAALPPFPLFANEDPTLHIDCKGPEIELNADKIDADPGRSSFEAIRRAGRAPRAAFDRSADKLESTTAGVE